MQGGGILLQRWFEATNALLRLVVLTAPMQKDVEVLRWPGLRATESQSELRQHG